HQTQRGSLFFDGVRVPATNRIGDPGSGFGAAMTAFDFNRAIIALACVGAALQSLDETTDHVRTRETFGKPLASRQGVSFQIAEHLSHLHAARLVAYHALRLADEGRRHTSEAAMAKWLGPKAAVDAIHACLVLHGWPGYGSDLPFASRMLDVVGLEIGDGTPEIMKLIIAREAIGRQSDGPD
ncbi:MAG: acyl-CoA dehydrogenase family protein, partial [Acidimicrobiia bacterium]